MSTGLKQQQTQIFAAKIWKQGRARERERELSSARKEGVYNLFWFQFSSCLCCAFSASFVLLSNAV